LTTPHIPDEAENLEAASEADSEEINNPTGTAVEEAPQDNIPDWESGLPASPEVVAAIRERPHHFADPEGRTSLISPPSRGLPERPNASVPEPVVAWWLLPLVWCNHLFDYCTFALGEPGAWLRSGPGRTVLGWCGLLLLAGAVAWAVLVEFG
jgi:hypothetical protein